MRKVDKSASVHATRQGGLHWPHFWYWAVDEVNVSNCSDQDRLSREWLEAVDEFANCAARLEQSLEDGNFQERYQTSRLTKEYADSASRALEIHCQMNQCKLLELRASKPPEQSAVSVPFLLLRPSVPHGQWQLHAVHCWRSIEFDPNNVQIIEATKPEAWIAGELNRNHGTYGSADFCIMPCLRLWRLVDVFKGHNR
jgi:hypothetical protein